MSEVVFSYICKNCGKKNYPEKTYNTASVFCDRKCNNEYRSKQALEKLKSGAKYSGRTLYNRHNPERALRALALREQGLTLQQIGDELGVTRERARQLVIKGQWFKDTDSE